MNGLPAFCIVFCRGSRPSPLAESVYGLKFSGGIALAELLESAMPSLETLLLSRNAFSGKLPESWGASRQKLKFFRAGANMLTGSLPAGKSCLNIRLPGSQG